MDATVDRVGGRKRWASVRLFDGELTVADAEGLFVELLPGQPNALGALATLLPIDRAGGRSAIPQAPQHLVDDLRGRRLTS